MDAGGWGPIEKTSESRTSIGLQAFLKIRGASRAQSLKRCFFDKNGLEPSCQELSVPAVFDFGLYPMLNLAPIAMLTMFGPFRNESSVLGEHLGNTSDVAEQLI